MTDVLTLMLANLRRMLRTRLLPASLAAITIAAAGLENRHIIDSRTFFMFVLALCIATGSARIYLDNRNGFYMAVRTSGVKPATICGERILSIITLVLILYLLRSAVFYIL